MAMVTENLGFGITCTLSFKPPYPFARRMSSLDHLTDGRVGWSIVTGYLNSAARGVSGTDQTGHEPAYEIGDEYMDVIHKLWEGSWEDGAVGPRPGRRDLHASGEGPQGSRRRQILQRGRRASVRAVAATHTGAVSGRRVDQGSCLCCNGYGMCLHCGTHQTRARPPRGRTPQRRARGRPFRIRSAIFTLLTAIVGRTDEEAHAKYAEYRSYISYESALALMAGGPASTSRNTTWTSPSNTSRRTPYNPPPRR